MHEGLENMRRTPGRGPRSIGPAGGVTCAGVLVRRLSLLLLFATACSSEEPAGHLWVAGANPQSLTSTVFASGSRAFVGLSTEMAYREQRWPTIASVASDDEAVVVASKATEVPGGLYGDGSPQAMVELQCGSAGSAELTVTADTGEIVHGDVRVAAPVAARSLVAVLDANLVFPWTQGLERIVIDALVPPEGVILVQDEDGPELEVAAEAIGVLGQGLAGWGSLDWTAERAGVVAISEPRMTLDETVEGDVLRTHFLDLVALDAVGKGTTSLGIGGLLSIPIEVVDDLSADRLQFYAMGGNGVLRSHELLAESAGEEIALRVGDHMGVFVMPFAGDGRPILGLHRGVPEVTEGADHIELLPTAEDIEEGRVVGSDHMILVTATSAGTAAVRIVMGGVTMTIPIVVE